MIDRLDDEDWTRNASRRSVQLASQWTIESQAQAMLQIYAKVAAGALIRR